MRLLSAFAPALALLAVPAAAQGGGFTAGFDPPLAVDINPDPSIVEVNLTAAPITWQFKPGVDTDVFAYNGSIPGPLIDAKIGDTLIVHFTNNLGEPTTIHWHGVDTPADMDGSHISQLTIPDGGTFTYQFDLLTPGLKWYHPHVRTDVMVESGLYGPLLVRRPGVDLALGMQGEEHIIMFDDIALDDMTGQLETFDPQDPLERTIYFLSGRRGNTLLVNGKEATTVTLPVPNGEPQRWYVVNVSNATFTRLDLNEYYASLPASYGDPPQLVSERWTGPVWKVGGDRGYIQRREQRGAIFEVEGGPSPTPSPDPHPTAFDERVGILLTPGERMEVSFTPYGDDGEILPVAQWDWPRGDHVAFYMPDGVTIGLGDEPFDGFDDTLPYFEMVLVGQDPGPPYWEPPVLLVPDTDLDPAMANKTVAVNFGHASPAPTGDVTMFAQMAGGGPKPMAAMTSVEAYDFEVGDLVEWELNNLSHGDHPFHTHGFAFRAYELEQIDMVTPANNLIQAIKQENKDTILLPQRPGAKGSSRTIIRALMSIDDTGRVGQTFAAGKNPSSSTSGGWLFHCHILEHAKAGMMSFFEVRDPSNPFANMGGGAAEPGGTFSYLDGSGTVAGGNLVTMSLTEANPGVPSVPIIGLSEFNLPISGGGVLIPFPDFYLLGLVTDGNGELDIPFTWPGSLPPGFTVTWQFWNIETGGVLSASNAVRITQP